MPRTAADIEEIRLRFSGASCFSGVLKDDDWSDHYQVFVATLDPALEPGFAAAIRDEMRRRRKHLRDGEVEEVLRRVLAPQLPEVGFDYALELDAHYDFDPDKIALPESVEIVVTFSRPPPARAPRPAPPPAQVTDAERRVLDRREKEAERSRSRRERARAAREAAGIVIRVGKVGYVRRVFDDERDCFLWEPTEIGAPVMRAMDAVWGKTITSGSRLAEHLNGLPDIHPIETERFTPNMMTELIRHLERLRRSSTV